MRRWQALAHLANPRATRATGVTDEGIAETIGLVALNVLINYFNKAPALRSTSRSSPPGHLSTGRTSSA